MSIIFIHLCEYYISHFLINYNGFYLTNLCIIMFIFFRMVNEVLAEELKEIHAFSQKTLTIEQWNNINKN